MNKIIEKIVEPNRIEVGSTFLLKVKVKDILTSAKLISSEQGIQLVTEDNKPLRSEWGE